MYEVKLYWSHALLSPSGDKREIYHGAQLYEVKLYWSHVLVERSGPGRYVSAVVGSLKAGLVVM